VRAFFQRRDCCCLAYLQQGPGGNSEVELSLVLIHDSGPCFKRQWNLFCVGDWQSHPLRNTTFALKSVRVLIRLGMNIKREATEIAVYFSLSHDTGFFVTASSLVHTAARTIARPRDPFFQAFRGWAGLKQAASYGCRSKENAKKARDFEQNQKSFKQLLKEKLMEKRHPRQNTWGQTPQQQCSRSIVKKQRR
jgi:hypothetical protein